MQEAQLLEEGGSGGGPAGSGTAGGGPPRRHHSVQRLTRSEMSERREEDGALVVPDHQGNLRITVKKTKSILGIAIEGGANTKHPLPRIINIHDNGAAYEAGGLEVGQLILEVDGQKVEGKASRVQILLEAASTKRTKDAGTYSDCHGGNRTSLTWQIQSQTKLFESAIIIIK
ncbi:hypothetical protein HN011_005863 [Eciton burchellii]|nr:hypothetical protein HN011_005863 [Eciton burchellii]